VGGPYEAFGDFGVALIVDLETAVFHHVGAENPSAQLRDEPVLVDGATQTISSS
jgi:hypothetical protein